VRPLHALAVVALAATVGGIVGITTAHRRSTSASRDESGMHSTVDTNGPSDTPHIKVMWRTLPFHGTTIAEVRVEGSGEARDIVIVPKSGQRLRFQAAGDVIIETFGRILVRTTAIDRRSLRITYSAEPLLLERAEVAFDEGEAEWQALWRRAQTRSLPWWREADGDELDLDRMLHARLTLHGPTASSTDGSSTSSNEVTK
jgi:hypothetical protein